MACKFLTTCWKSYPFFSQRLLQWKVSWPEKVSRAVEPEGLSELECFSFRLPLVGSAVAIAISLRFHVRAISPVLNIAEIALLRKVESLPDRPH